MIQSAIVTSCNAGWVIDQRRAVTLNVLGSTFLCPSSLFSVTKPYFSAKHSADDRGHCFEDNVTKGCVIKDDANENGIAASSNRRKRKLNSMGKAVSSEFGTHSDDKQQLQERLYSAKEKLIKATECTGHFTCLVDEEQEGTQDWGSDVIDFIGLSNLANECGIFADVEHIFLNSDGDTVADVFNRIVQNRCEASVIMKALNTEFIIPPSSVFLMSDIQNIGKLLDGVQRYDFIVIDPPWSNKSAKRTNRYKSLTFNHIKYLPISKAAANGSLIAVWATNKKKVTEFVKEELFPFWSCSLIGEWYWLKVTTKGDLVCELDSVHKKPYERLFIGRFMCPEHKLQQQQIAPKSEHQNMEEFPYDKVICSIPCRLHSRKPPLNEVLLDYLPLKAECLELFARNLLPGWTSWGNEVLKHQNVLYFDKCC